MGFLRDLLGLFSQKQYGTPSRTMQGETVKSRAEQRIADYFTRQGIRYVYEYGTRTNSLVIKRTFAKPDFYLPDYNVYVEYWGLVDASKEYEKNMKWKMAQYHQNRIRFISLYPKNMQNLDWVFRAKFKKELGFELPTLPRRAQAGAKYCMNCGTPTVLPARFCAGCGKAIV